METQEGQPVEETTTQEDSISEPEVTSEGTTTEEEGSNPVLPSDVEKFEVPEKFKGKSAEEIAKAYVELEKLKSKEVEPPSDTPEDEQTTTEPSLEELAMQEFTEMGEISEETYTSLEEAGYTREEVDDKIEYEKYKYQKALNEVTEEIGGPEVYKEVSQWVNDTLPPEEVEELGAEMARTSLKLKKLIVKALYNDYLKANNLTEPTGDVIHTNENQYVSSRGYASQVELDEDMADARYGTDRAYTKAVEEKLSRTNLDRL